MNFSKVRFALVVLSSLLFLPVVMPTGWAEDFPSEIAIEPSNTQCRLWITLDSGVLEDAFYKIGWQIKFAKGVTLHVPLGGGFIVDNQLTVVDGSTTSFPIEPEGSRLFMYEYDRTGVVSLSATTPAGDRLEAHCDLGTISKESQCDVSCKNVRVNKTVPEYHNMR